MCVCVRERETDEVKRTRNLRFRDHGGSCSPFYMEMVGCWIKCRGLDRRVVISKLTRRARDFIAPRWGGVIAPLMHFHMRRSKFIIVLRCLEKDY